MLGWVMYDFANSPFTTIINSLLFNVYFTDVVVGEKGVIVFGLLVPASSLWTYIVSLSVALIVVTAPVLGAVADLSASKKRFLFAYCYAGCLSTGLLFFAGEGGYVYASLLYIVANYAFSASSAFYNSFLPEIATKDNVGRISGLGWGVGFLGGGVSLALSLMLLREPGWFGVPREDHLPIRSVFIVVALWWAVFSLFPLFLLKERASPSPLPAGLGYTRAGFMRLIHTFRKVRLHRELFKYLTAFLVYNVGVETIMVIGAVLGSRLFGIESSEMVLAFLIGQVIATLGAFSMGWLADVLSNRVAIIFSLFVWLFVVVWAFFMDSKAEFWVIGAIIAFILAGTQSASRALFGLFTPRENSAEFYGLYALCSKFGTLIGPLVFGVLVQFFSAYGILGFDPLRVALLSLDIFFLVGIVLICFVSEKKGIEESLKPVV